MKKSDASIVFGLLLIAAGAIFLGESFGFLRGATELFWGLLFGAGGLAFLIVFLLYREHWWALIPGFSMLGIASLMALESLAPRAAAQWGAVLVLGSISLAFWLIYLMHREFWWAVIPAGVLATLTIVSLFAENDRGFEAGGFLFVGIGLTFILLAYLPTPDGRQRWALIPAAVLIPFGLLIMMAGGPWINMLWSLALVAAGVFLVIRTLRRRQVG